MININQRVWKLLEADLAVKKCLSKKVVNTRALARYLIDKHDLKSSLDAVISAIRRFEAQGGYEREEAKIKNLLKNSLISTRTNITCFTLKLNSVEFLKRIKDINVDIPGTRISAGSYEIKLIVTNGKAELFRKKFRDEIIKEDSDLGEIRLELSEEACKTKGVLARIATELSLHDTNIEELIICPPEFSIYVKEKDMVKAHQSLVELTRV